MAINLRLHDNWFREYQVLPRRTHPMMNMTQLGGYILSGIKIIGDTDDTTDTDTAADTATVTDDMQVDTPDISTTNIVADDTATTTATTTNIPDANTDDTLPPNKKRIVSQE